MRRVTHERYISQSQKVNCDLARRYVGLNLPQLPLSGGDPYDITLIRLNQVSLDRRRREKVNWEMITEHSCNPFANLEAGMLEQFSTHP